MRTVAICVIVRVTHRVESEGRAALEELVGSADSCVEDVDKST
jgi:hypothetical protein